MGKSIGNPLKNQALRELVSRPIRMISRGSHDPNTATFSRAGAGKPR